MLCPCGEPVGHADHCGFCCGGCGVASEHERMATVEHLRRCPMCDMRFTPEPPDDRLRESIARLEAPRPKCDFCGQPGIELAGETNGMLVCIDHAARAVTPRYTSDAEAKLDLVRGLLAAYGDAEGTPVDYEFLVHHIGEAIK